MTKRKKQTKSKKQKASKIQKILKKKLKVRLVSGDGMELVTKARVYPPDSYGTSAYILRTVKVPTTTYFEQGSYPVWYRTKRRYEYFGNSIINDKGETLPAFLEVNYDGKKTEI